MSNLYKNKIATFILFLTFGLLLILLILLFNYKAEENLNGYGFEAEGFDDIVPSEELIGDDSKIAQLIPDDLPIEVIEPLDDSRYEFLRDPDRSRWYSGDYNMYFEIEAKDNPANNVLRIQDENIEIFGVYKGDWSFFNNYILFSKIEDSGAPNYAVGNIWIFKLGDKDAKEIFSSSEEPNIDYVTNERKIAFVTKNTVQIMNLDGSDRKVIYSFEEFNNRSEMPYVPLIQITSKDTFKVNIKKPTYFSDKAEENIEFDFEGNKVY